MHTHHGKPRERNDHTLWHKRGCQLSSIRVRLTLWYVVTTTAVLALFGGLLWSTIAKMMPTPAPDPTALPRVALNLFWLGLALLVFIIAGGYWFAVRAMRPVRLMTQTAQEIGRTNSSRRFHLTRRD